MLTETEIDTETEIETEIDTEEIKKNIGAEQILFAPGTPTNGGRGSI